MVSRLSNSNMKTQQRASPAVPSADIWEFLFERPSLPFPPDHVIFRSATTDDKWTYQGLRDRAEQFGRALQSSWQWSKDDVLMVIGPNDIDLPPVIWGCHYAGGIVAPVNPALSVQGLRQQLERSEARGLVVHPDCLPVTLKAARLANIPKERILALRSDRGQPTNDGTSTVDQFIANAQVASDMISSRPKIDSQKDTAFLVYSSGTTGHPKGVMVSHQNVVADVFLQSVVESDHIDWRQDRTLAVLPIYHIYGLTCLVHAPVYLGTTTIYLQKFELAAFCRSIQDYQITHVYVAPPIVLHLTKNDKVSEYNLQSLRMITSGGAPLPANLITELYERRKLAVRQAYGLSETTSITHIQRWDAWKNGIGSNGQSLPGVEAKFVINDTRAAAIGEEGELWIRGPTVFNGYRGEPELTAGCMTKDGWFKTGDIGHEDEFGNMFITDRSKDLIKFKGYQVPPAELEDLIIKHETVEDVAVIGIMNDSLASEVPLAYIVVKSGISEDEATAKLILDHVKNQTVNYKHLRGGIIFTKEIPKSASGKILKRALRQQATADGVRRIGAINYEKYPRATKL